MSIEIIENPNQLLKELREAFEKKSAGWEVKFNNLNQALDKHEAENQKLTLELQQKASKIEELEKQWHATEADLKRNLGGEEKQAKTQELKAFEDFLVKGAVKMAINPEIKLLRQSDDTLGGYLSPAEYSNEIIKKITEVSPVRSVARVISTTRKEIQVPSRSGLVAGGWISELQTANQSNSTYGQETIKAEKMMVYTDISYELLNDSVFNMRSEITSDIAEDMARLEGAAFVNGNGVAKPQGLMSASGIGETNSGSASALTSDCLFTIQGFIPTGYNLTWMFNRKTLNGNIRTLKDNQGQYLFVSSIGSREMPNTVAGLPYILANDMPDVAAGTYPIILGDFRKCYTIVDNVNFELLEDPYTQAIVGKRRFVVYKRTGGKVVLTEGLRKIKISA